MSFKQVKSQLGVQGSMRWQLSDKDNGGVGGE